MRPIDLARAAGISTASVRFYENEGILPPVPRLASGHRQYTGIHLEALRVARALMHAYGWEWARDAMRLVHAGDIRALVQALDHAHADANRQREELASALAMLDALTRNDLPALPGQRARKPRRIGDVARVIGVPATTIRFWEDQGLFASSRDPENGYRLYGATAVRDLQIIVILREAGYGIAAMRPILGEIANRNPVAARAILLQRQDQIDLTSQKRYAAVSHLWQYLDRFARAPSPA